MSKFFVPYSGESPAAVDIKGHRLLIISPSPDTLVKDLQVLGGNTVREFDVFDGDAEPFANLAASVQGGVVVTPPGVSLPALIFSLEQELPWLH